MHPQFSNFTIRGEAIEFHNFTIRIYTVPDLSGPSASMIDSPLLSTLLEPWLAFLADDPMLRSLQIGMLLLGVLLIFLVFYTCRDILLRSHSLFFMIASLVLVTALPLFGFLLYLLIRPARTLKEREVEKLLRDLVEGRKTLQVAQIRKVPAKKTSKK